MNPHPNLWPRTTRREFLRTGGKALSLIAFSSVAPSFLTRSAWAQTPPPGKDQTILVLIQLAGGNDGLNTVVPYEDPLYHRLRPNLGLGESEVLPLDGGMGLHPSCEPLLELMKEGRAGILQGVGYPNPNRSHFRSMEIWETASASDRFLSTGWVGRYFDHACSGEPSTDPAGVHFGDQTPLTFQGEEFHSLYAGGGRRGRRDADPELLGALARVEAGGENLNFLNHTLLDAMAMDERVQGILGGYRPMASYPGSRLGQSLRQTAALIASGSSTRLYFNTLGGFDTHANQAGQHARLLADLSASLAAFQQDLEGHGLDDRVLTMTFSEFGRRPNENASAGTDHGTSAPLFVMGNRVAAGLLGDRPNLEVANGADIPYTIDFRSVYATVIERWLHCPAATVLGGEFPQLDFLDG